jgi:ATP phosphoribosyltransferase regulatory subunit
LQFGAELFGHDGLEADLEVAELALDCLRVAQVSQPVIDLADARVLRGVLAGVPMDAEGLQDVARALASKDAPALALLCQGLPEDTRAALLALLRLYGNGEVLPAARAVLPDRPLIRTALDELAWLGSRLQAADPGLRVAFDLSDMSGYAYYSGPRFALFAAGCSDTLARGGRYDEVGAVFGRSRPAVGFSLDLKSLSELAPAAQPRRAILALWSEDASMRAEVRRLRAAGEVVVTALPGAAAGGAAEAAAWQADRELVNRDGRWLLQPLNVADAT